MMQRLEAMVWALDRINNSPNLLPNITLGILYPKFLTKKLLFNHVTSWSKFESWQSWNFSFQILNKLLAQNVDQSLAKKSRPNISLKISTKLSSTHSSTSTSATLTTSRSFELVSSKARVILVKSTIQQWLIYTWHIQKVLLGKCYWSTFALFFYLRLFFWKKWDDLEDLELRLYLSLYFKIFSKIIF